MAPWCRNTPYCTSIWAWLTVECQPPPVCVRASRHYRPLVANGRLIITRCYAYPLGQPRVPPLDHPFGSYWEMIPRSSRLYYRLTANPLNSFIELVSCSQTYTTTCQNPSSVNVIIHKTRIGHMYVLDPEMSLSQPSQGTSL